MWTLPPPAGCTRRQPDGVYRHLSSRLIADSRVTGVGVGELGRAVVERLGPLEVAIAWVSSSCPRHERGRVLGLDELGEVLPCPDLLLLALARDRVIR